MTFQALEVHNDWNFLTYTLAGAPFPTDRGGLVDVRMPDGTIHTDVEYTIKDRHTTVDDHGKTYPVTQHIPTVTVCHLGLEVEIELSRLEVDNARPHPPKERA